MSGSVHPSFWAHCLIKHREQTAILVMDASLVASIEVNKDYLCVRFSGEYSLNDVKRCTSEIVRAYGQHGITRVLVDITNIAGRIDLWHHFRQVEYLSTLLSQRVRMALVTLPEQGEPAHFIETVAMNRGLILRQFTGLEEAIEWLKSGAHDPGPAQSHPHPG
jgi:hypothetical protein